MIWSLRIARIAGIDLNIHLSFLLMLPLGALIFGEGAGAAGMAFGMLMIVLLFSCVLLHELGHALTARALGIPVREIRLLPIGGVAVLGRPVVNPGHELLIAIMGPVVNVLLIIALAIVALATGVAARLSPETVVSAMGTPGFDGALLWLIQANALLAIFNIIPAFPLDGGRVLRSALAIAMPYRRATLIAAVIGQGLALLMGLWGLMGLNLLLIASALFIFLAARQEVAASEAIGMLSGVRVAEALAAQPPAVMVGQRVREAAAQLALSGQRAAAVLQGERPIGLVLLGDLQAAVAAGKGELWVTLAMRRHFVALQASASLDDARITMAEQETPAVAVFDGEAFRGLLTVDDIAAALSARSGGDTPPARPEATPST